MKALVIGANGQLGSDLVREWESRDWDVSGATHDDVRVEDQDSVRSIVNAVRPDVILNTAAFHQVPACEQNPARTLQVNAIGALNVARAAEEAGARCVYFSTDYVFDGVSSEPYTERDLPNPLNVYGGSKLLGEYYTVNYTRRGTAVRISGIYGRVPCRAKGGNFVTTMLKAAREKPEVRVVTDEVLSPTSTAAIARGTAGLVGTDLTGTVHMVCEGFCSWYDFARVIFSTLGLKTPLVQASVRDFPSAVRRPAFSALRNERLNALGTGAMPHWRNAIMDFLNSMEADGRR